MRVFLGDQFGYVCTSRAAGPAVLHHRQLGPVPPVLGPVPSVLGPVLSVLGPVPSVLGPVPSVLGAVPAAQSHQGPSAQLSPVPPVLSPVLSANMRQLQQDECSRYLLEGTFGLDQFVQQGLITAVKLKIMVIWAHYGRY